MNLRIPYPPARGAQGGAINAAAASASAAAPAAASDAFGSVNRRRFFVELDASAVALVLAPYNEQELQVTQLPTDWLVDAPPDELVCCICTDIAWQAPNLQCGQSSGSKRQTAPSNARSRLIASSLSFGFSVRPSSSPHVRRVHSQASFVHLPAMPGTRFAQPTN
jgi:hypothetical protein